MLVLTIEVKDDYSFQELWNSIPRDSAADETLAIVHEYGMENDLMQYLSGYFTETPSIRDVERILRCDRDNIFKAIELDFEAWEAEKEEA